MITSKQRAFLRKEANGIPSIFNIGKGGLCDNFLKQADDALEARELIKIHILETSFLDTRETCNKVAELLSAESVQSIGSKFVLYRRSKRKDVEHII